MPQFSLTGSDTAVIAGLVLRNVCDGDWFLMQFDEDLAAVKVGKDGNAIFASNAQGQRGSATLRLLRGSDDDKAMDSLLQTQLADFSAFELLDGSFVKRIGDGSGNVTPDQYIAEGGIFKRMVDAKSNAEGDTEQSVSVYRFEFSRVARVQS